MSADSAEKKALKEKDLVTMFDKDSKFSSEAIDQASIDKEMSELEEQGKEESYSSILLLDACTKIRDEKLYKDCKEKVINNK